MQHHHHSEWNADPFLAYVDPLGANSLTPVFGVTDVQQ
jgi:hypothetical protein